MRRDAHRIDRKNGINRKRAWQLTIWLLPLALLVMPLLGTPVAAAAADDQARALVEFRVPDQQAIDELLALGADLAEYVRQNDDGSLTINAFVTPDERAYYESLGYQAGETIEDESTWEAAKAEREAAIAAEQAAKDAAQYGAPVGPRVMAPMMQSFAPRPEIIIQRVDYFTNYAGSFLSVEANDSLGTNTGGPTLAMSWAEAGGSYGTASNMSKYTDDHEYMYHQLLVRVSAAGSTTPVPAMVRVASSTGETAEAPVNIWLGGGLPPLPAGYLKGFLNHYMDPYEGKTKIEELAAEFPDIAEIIPLPEATNGYQRMSMAIMNGTGDIGTAPPRRSEAELQAVALFATAYGQEGGNDVQAEFLDPGAANQPLTVSVSGSRITVGLGTDSSGALASTAAEVVAAINAYPDASALVEAHTWNNGSGTGIVQPRVLVNLSDFLSAPANYPRGPFHVEMLHIGTRPASLRDAPGAKTGVFIYCQQHAREWATPNTCLETAERLVRNYAIDPTTKSFVDNLDIFIVPSANPDGALYSYYDYNSQRKNMTNYCSPEAASGAMPSNRNSWGVDINRNGSTGSAFDGYDGASATNCTDITYAGPSEWSEPEYRNLMWVDETYNVKFSMNTHSYGGYFMWPPGSYTADGRVTLPAANIGINEYFFAAADRVLNRVKEERNTVILPARTGPVCDVLYSAAGNSADDEYYLWGIFGWDFETGADLFTSTSSGTSQHAVGFQPDFDTEGNYEALEFASGNYGLLEVALDFANDTTPSVANIVPDGGISQTPIDATFQYGNEPSVIYYTLDGSTPTTSSTMWEAQGPRLPGQVFEFDQNTMIKWIAQDAKGNVSGVRSADFVIDNVPPTIAPTLAAPVLLHGSTTATPTATDDNSGVASASCDPLDTSSVGEKTITCTATDEAGNTTTASVKYNVVYGFAGFSAPVGSSLNTANAGQAIPLKWRLTDANGAPVTMSVAAEVTAETLACPIGTTADNGEEDAAGASGLQNLGDGYYQFNWKTPKSYARSCKTMKLDLGEGAGLEHTAQFSFTK